MQGLNTKDVLKFVIIAFTLLGALFGMQIMAFILGTVGNSNVEQFDLSSNTRINETGFINSSGYLLTDSTTKPGFSSPSILIAVNATSNLIINSGNYTILNNRVINNSAILWQSVNFTYSYDFKGDTRVAVESINNDSLQAIQTYTEGSNTQLNTVSIAITLVILVAVFLFFWAIFVGRGRSKDNSNKGNYM